MKTKKQWQLSPYCAPPRQKFRSGFAVRCTELAVRCTEPAVKYFHIPTPAPHPRGILVGIWSSNTPPGSKTLTQCNPLYSPPNPMQGVVRWGMQLTGALC